MRYGIRPGTGSGVAWGLVALLLGLIGLAFPLLLVAVALVLIVRAVVWFHRDGGKDGLGSA